MSYSKVEAEEILRERMMKANEVVNNLNSQIEQLEKEKVSYLIRRDEASYALGVVNQMREARD